CARFFTPQTRRRYVYLYLGSGAAVVPLPLVCCSASRFNGLLCFSERTWIQIAPYEVLVVEARAWRAAGGSLDVADSSSRGGGEVDRQARGRGARRLRGRAVPAGDRSLRPTLRRDDERHLPPQDWPLPAGAQSAAGGHQFVSRVSPASQGDHLLGARGDRGLHKRDGVGAPRAEA